MTRKEKLAILNNSDNKLWVDALKWFLEGIKLGLWKRYLSLIDDYLDYDGTCAFSIYYCISDAFDWDTTREGMFFWDGVSCLWECFIDNLWKDYKSFKEDIIRKEL